MIPCNGPTRWHATIVSMQWTCLLLVGAAREPRTRGHATDADGALCGRGGRGLSEACYVLKWSPFVFGTRVREFRARAVGAVVWTSVDVCVRG